MNRTKVPGINPQWGLHAPRLLPKILDWYVKATHDECDNAVCNHTSFMYGYGHRNPSKTIAAVAERSCEKLLKELPRRLA